MLKDDFEMFSKIWEATLAVYGKQATQQQIGMTFRALQDYDLYDVRRAIDSHMKDPDQGRFIPKPADIVRHVTGDPETRAMQAWTKVQDAIGRKGPWKSIIFDEREIMATIEDMGGWQSLCMIDDKELPFKANEFQKRYKGYLIHPPLRHPPKLVGIAEAENNRNGMPTLEHDQVVIGDPQRAALVYQSGKTKQIGSTKVSDILKMIETKKPLELGHEDEPTT